VKRRLRDSGLLGRVPLFSVCSFAHLNLLLASLRCGFFFATLLRRPVSQSRLFTVDVETGVFCGYYLMKLPVEDL
jgi:hypothetical protein